MTCPICASESDPKYRPFCSRRCADADLGRWLSGAYAVPANDDEALEEAAEEMARETPRPH